MKLYLMIGVIYGIKEVVKYMPEYFKTYVVKIERGLQVVVLIGGALLATLIGIITWPIGVIVDIVNFIKKFKHKA